MIESCHEVMKEDLVVAIQDMGAAGLTSSSFEMASKGGVGFRIELDKVPLRDSSMSPEDILLSESQERMLLVCEPAKFERIAAIFHRWNLDAVKIGEVTTKKTVELHWKGEVLTDIDPDLLVENAPQYQRPYSVLPPQNRTTTRSERVAKVDDAKQELINTLKDVRGTSREFIYRQYDSRVGASTARDCTDSVGVIRLKDSGRGLGVVLGCRPHVMRFDARVGGLDAVAYPALELAAKGFEALAVTDCLNFGNPEREAIMSEFVAALDGMNAICANLEAPIISGNVSFYNETMGRNITSTPSTGIVGLRDSVTNLPHSQFARAGLAIYVLRLPGIAMGGTLQEIRGGQIKGDGELNAQSVGGFIRVTRDLVNLPAVSATRVVGKFGLAYALARMSLGGFGAIVDGEGLKMIRSTLDREALFEEHLYEVILGVDESRISAFEDRFSSLRQASPTAELHRIGRTREGRLEIGSFIESDTASLVSAYENGWGANFESLA